MAGANRKSFDELALPHLDYVYRVARWLSRDDHEAQDLVQETFLKAYRAFGDFEIREFGIRPWLLKILHNTFFNRQARERRAPKVMDQEGLEQAAGGASYQPPPDLDYESLDQEVKNALDHLSPEFRAVVLLWATMEHSYQEIANILDVPIGTVMSRLYRARRQLTRALESFARDRRITPVKPAE